MTKKDFFRKLSYGFGRAAIGCCDFGARVVPLSFLYGFANVLAWIMYHFAVKQRRVALESLCMAMGQDKTHRELEAIARRCFFTMAGTAVEFFMFMRHPGRIMKFVVVEGLEYLDQALARGRGVVAVSAHFGSFPLLLSRLALGGYKIHSLMRHMRDMGLDKFFEKKRDRMGVGSIYTQPRQECVNSTLKALRNNEIVFIQLDQNFGTGGVFVNFFGVKAATATGPVVFSQRTGAPLVPMFITRIEGPRHKITILPPLELDGALGKDEAVVSMIQSLTSLIEGYIRRYPHEWGWIHKRWKARPKDEGRS